MSTTNALDITRFMAIASIGFLLSIAMAAQQPESKAAQPAQSREAGDGSTIKSHVRQVVVDVVVTDIQNRPIKGLRQEDFSVTEDGIPQRIAYFEAHNNSSDGSVQKIVTPPVLPPGTFVNVAVTDEHLPLNVLLFDVLNTPPEELPYAREQVVKFFRMRPPGSHCAIFVLSDELRLVQGFTDDERRLLAAIDSKYASALHGASGEFLDASELFNGAGSIAADPEGQGSSALLKSSESAGKAYYLGRRTEQTIAAFTEIAKFLNGLPGRKNLIWLSGSFPSGIFVGSNPRNPFAISVNYAPELQQAVNLLAVGQVAVYPVDARGLGTDPAYSGRGGGLRGGDPAGYSKSQLDEHGTMDEIADGTGGHAFYNTNGLAQAIATSMNDGSNYYSLSYNPSNTSFDGRVRKIHVKVPSNGYHLAYRRTYVAYDDSVVVQNAAVAPVMRIQTALIRGAPLAHDITLRVDIHPEGSTAVVTQKQIDLLSQFPAFASQKSWDEVRVQHYVIEYGFLGGKLSVTPTSDGARSGIFEVELAAFDAANRPMYVQWTRIEKTYSPAEFAEIQKGAYRLKQEPDIPSGAAWLRLAVRDAIGNHLGSIEIPLPVPGQAQTKEKPSPN